MPQLYTATYYKTNSDFFLDENNLWDVSITKTGISLKPIIKPTSFRYENINGEFTPIPTGYNTDYKPHWWKPMKVRFDNQCNHCLKDYENEDSFLVYPYRGGEPVLFTKLNN